MMTRNIILPALTSNRDPKSGKESYSNRKAFHPTCLWLCLAKIMEKVFAARLTNVASLIADIFPQYIDCLHGVSTNDTLVTLLTTAQVRL